jgi:hypothetical protein
LGKQIDLAESKSRLDSLALELLRGRFPKVDVEPYYSGRRPCGGEYEAG